MHELCTSALRAGSRYAFGAETTACTAANNALQTLLEGNGAFLNAGRNGAEISPAIRLRTAHEGQHPNAVTVCCADSRVPPEHIFHAGIGDLFVIRNAGNLMTPAALGSVEYAVGHLHTPLVLILGHRGCGAVASALVHGQADSHPEEGALGALIAQVAENVGHVRDPQEAELHNLKAALRALGDSPLLRRLAEAGRFGAAGGIYDIRSGSVTLLRD